jgi:hypothetical protein
MDFTTPPSYGPSQVTVGGIAVDGEVLFAGANPDTTVEHTSIKNDPENGWPEPSAIVFTWKGKTKDGKDAWAELRATLERTDRVDVMIEVPKFVKQIVAGAAGTKPYIYQYNQKMTLKIKIGDEPEKTEEGRMYSEATFIT